MSNLPDMTDAELAARLRAGLPAAAELKRRGYDIFLRDGHESMTFEIVRDHKL